MKWHKQEYWISDEPDDIDIEVVYHYLAHESYWSKGIPKATLERSLKNSLCFSLFFQHTQIGFARIISDYATIAYLGDVFVLEGHRGLGLGKWMMQCVSGHSNLQKLRRWFLATSDAHGLYQQFDFKALAKPEIFMERLDTEVYNAQPNQNI